MWHACQSSQYTSKNCNAYEKDERSGNQARWWFWFSIAIDIWLSFSHYLKEAEKSLQMRVKTEVESLQDESWTSSRLQDVKPHTSVSCLTKFDLWHWFWPNAHWILWWKNQWITVQNFKWVYGGGGQIRKFNTNYMARFFEKLFIHKLKSWKIFAKYVTKVMDLHDFMISIKIFWTQQCKIYKGRN